MIITERFLATHKGPVQIGGGLEWSWHRRSGLGPNYKITFDPKTRSFSGGRTSIAGMIYRPFSKADVAKLRRMLPPEAVAVCTAAVIGGDRCLPPARPCSTG